MLRPRGVPLAISGKCRTKPGILRARLGDTAWWVLQVLWGHRAKNGETHITNLGLTHAKGFAAMPITCVKHAVCLLKTAGLLTPIGWRLREVPCGKGRATIWVFMRYVAGAPAEGSLGADSVLFVPAETIAWLNSPRGWGGPRDNSGGYRHGKRRKKTGKEAEVIKMGSTKELRSSVDLSKMGSTVSKMGSTPSQQDGVAELGSLSLTISVVSDSLASLGNAPVATSATGDLPAEPSGDRSSPPTSHPPDSGTDPTQLDGPPLLSVRTADLQPKDAAVAQGGVVCSASDTRLTRRVPVDTATPTGFRFESGMSRPRPVAMPSTTLPGIPAYPGASLIGLAVVPNPPVLEVEMSDLERAHKLADAYRGAIQARFGQVAWALKRGPLQGSKFYKNLVESAQTLLDHEIAPAAWAAWSCDVWKQYGDKKKPPPVPWVFSAKRIHERRGWFAAEEETYMGGRVVYGPKQTALATQYLRMRAAIDSAGAHQHPEPVVARYFPDGAYEAALAAARAEVKAKQTELQRAKDSGTFLW